MQVKFVAFLQNILTLHIIILCELENGVGFETFSCVRESQFGRDHTRVTFLLQESAGLRLYATLWSSDMRLMTCKVYGSPLVIENYSTFCSRSNEDERLTQKFNLNAVLSPSAPCIQGDEPSADHSTTHGEGKLRRKRSLIFPGTLWCGTGSKAYGPNELGKFESADRCCRDHDQCHHFIPAFTTKYGVFNPSFYTVSHCECDQRFRQCLLDVNDTVSSMVLFSFFKVLKVPCFELKLQKRCTELYWWGMCKVTKEAPHAIYKKPVYYNTSFTSKPKKSSQSNSTAGKVYLESGIQEIKVPGKTPRPGKNGISTKDPPRGDTFSRMKTNGCRRKPGESTVAPERHITAQTEISSMTKGMKSLSVHSAALITRNPYAIAISTTPTTASSSKRPHALQLTKPTTTSQRVTGHKLSTEKAFQPQNQKSPSARTFPAVVSTKHKAFTWTSVPYDAHTTTAKPITHYWENKTQSQEHTPFPARATNHATNSGSLPINETTHGEGKLRRKRSLIFPGTLWCGTGSKAFGPNELGMFESADRCCRDHDQCHHIIPAFTVKYGVFNPNFYTVSHCECDQRFRQCLLDVNDTVSSMVLFSFFKVLKVPCFELKLQKRCTELYWWGMCKVTKEAPYAIYKKPVYYNTSFTSKPKKSSRSKSTAGKVYLESGIQEIKVPRKKPMPGKNCISTKDPPRGDTFSRIKTNGCRRKPGESTVAPERHITAQTEISSMTKGMKSLSVHSAALITRNPYAIAISTTPTTASSSKRPHALQLTKPTTTSQRVTGHKLSTEKAFSPQNKKSPSARIFPAVVSTKHKAFTWTSVPYDAHTTTAKPITHYWENKTQSQEHTPFPARATNHATNSGSLPINETNFCERLKHLDECRYRIPPLKKRFGLKNLDTKPAYHCTCTKRLAQEIQSLKQSTLSFFLVDLVSEHCFKLPKKKTCWHRKSCSGGFSKASDLLQALKKIEQNDIAGVRNSGKLRKGRISVQLYKQCLRLRKEAMALLK